MYEEQKAKYLEMIGERNEDIQEFPMCCKLTYS